MAKINGIFVAISLIMIFSLMPIVISKPASQNNDLIVGNDFLSIILDQNESNQQHDTKYGKTRNIGRQMNNQDGIIYSDENVMINDDELLIQDNSNHYGKRTTEKKKTSNFQSPNSQFNNDGELMGTSGSKMDDLLNDNHQINDNSPLNKNFGTKQVVKFVTSGSKIVFLEDMTNDGKNSSMQNRNLMKKSLNETKNNTNVNESDNFKVLSVRVSSTVGKSRKNNNQNNNGRHNEQKPEKVTSTTPNNSNKNISISQSNGNTLRKRKHSSIERDVNKNDFINRSHKSEFSIEESEPVTQQDRVGSLFVDSVNGESTNIHSVLAPPTYTSSQQPTTINQSRNQHDISNNRDNNNNKNLNKFNSNENGSIISSSSSSSSSIGVNFDSNIEKLPSDTMKSGSVAVSRMQRKQDKLVPFQTVIYHDTGFMKDGNTQPRSISYSSIGQSIDDLNTWKDLESLITVKQNISESLKASNSEIDSKDYNQPEKVYSQPAKVYSEPAKVYGEPAKFYSQPAKVYSEPAKVYGEPEKQYGQPAKVYSEPAKVYGEPAKVYSEPAKVYGEPSKVYWPPPPKTPTTPKTTTTTMASSMQSSDSNFSLFGQKTSAGDKSNSRRVIFNLDKLPYDLLNAPEGLNKQLLHNNNSSSTGRKSRPTSLNNRNNPQTQSDSFDEVDEQKSDDDESYNYQKPKTGGSKIISSFSLSSNNPSSQSSLITNSNLNNPIDLVTRRPNYFPTGTNINNLRNRITTENPQDLYTPTPEQNYEIEESVSVMTNGRVHSNSQTTPRIFNSGISSTTPPPTDESKVGYVVEGRNFRKYRVEEKTNDGFIVGEYGVVSHNDGGVRGVRYTADSNINPNLIHQALMKFLSL